MKPISVKLTHAQTFFRGVMYIYINVHIFGERRLDDNLSGNVVKHTELLQKTFLVYKERAWRLFDKYRRVKLKVSAILSLK